MLLFFYFIYHSDLITWLLLLVSLFQHVRHDGNVQLSVNVMFNVYTPCNRLANDKSFTWFYPSVCVCVRADSFVVNFEALVHQRCWIIFIMWFSHCLQLSQSQPRLSTVYSWANHNQGFPLTTAEPITTKAATQKPPYPPSTAVNIRLHSNILLRMLPHALLSNIVPEKHKHLDVQVFPEVVEVTPLCLRERPATFKHVLSTHKMCLTA